MTEKKGQASRTKLEDLADRERQAHVSACRLRVRQQPQMLPSSHGGERVAGGRGKLQGN